MMIKRSPGPGGPDHAVGSRAIGTRDATPHVNTEDLSSGRRHLTTTPSPFVPGSGEPVVGDVVSDTGWRERSGRWSRLVLVVAAPNEQRDRWFRQMLFGDAFRGASPDEAAPAIEPLSGSDPQP